MSLDGGVVLPAERGGWWHAYVCPVHGGELVHARLLDGSFPKDGAACPHGCLIDTPAVRGAWAALAHQACARRIRLLGDEQPATAVGLLVEYAELHASLTNAGQHEQAASWMLRGRLFHQALSEAIWAVSVGHAAWTLASLGTAGLEPVLPMLDALAAAAVEARAELVGQGKFSSNYTAWLTAAEIVTSTAAGLIRGEVVERDWTTLYDHVLAATGDDGWEWEGSTYYHGFVLRAYLLTLRGVAPASLPEPVGNRLAAMIAVLTGIASPGGVLPALHDGPYERPATEEEWVELRWLADQFAGGLVDGWFGGPPRPAAEVPSTFGDVGYLVVRAGGVHAVLDAGPHGGSHGHLDKLSLYLYGDRTPWQPDPGQVPYASPLRAHYKSTDAHPAFRVDGLEQDECAGTLAGDVARCDSAYDGVSATRQLIRGDGYLVDVLRITADRERRLTALLRPGTEFEAVALPDGVVRTRWSGAEELTGWHVSSLPASFSVGSGFGMADDPQRFRSWVDWSADGEAVTFVSVYQAAGVAPKVTGIRLDGSDLAVERAGHEGSIHRTGVS
ncbi:heparinase II/III domain-containing protein [Tenggerimyces flavus]|uniref:Heparinase II/III family protein n=1 Tax=Tenggerimyces flavus TaxID=1708749 RepID=A0ABV7YQJ2_9ACTN|nr:heparinase II/III family protein [Tenggerimyces flavus]MBM7786422.1 hypothetical protein [Tenggerimyces flavus]